MPMDANSGLPPILLLFHIVLGLLIFVQSGAGLPSNNGDGDLNIQAARSSPSTRLNCNGSCVIDEAMCTIRLDSCYIEGECYEANQTRFNDSLSCLQCQPDNDQLNWGFNTECSAAEKCGNWTFQLQNLCPLDTIRAFYTKPTDATFAFYNFEACSRDRSRCQEGFFISLDERRTYACCPGYFCPEGQTCMIPCRKGGYCPGALSASNGTCRTPVNCPENRPKQYGAFGCGGSYFEGFCPNGTYCPTPAESVHCKNGTEFCPTGVAKPLPCPTGFVCLEGRARRQRIITNVLVSVLVIIIGLAICALVFEWMSLTKGWFGKHELVDPPGVSDYFRKATHPNDGPQKYIQLHIHLERARLRNVTRFDPEKNEGFTGRIAAGKLTALMGGSGCGKSSLLETIHGRRQLRKDGSITFADHQPLSTILTDYVGYVPQADIMHNDLTVFETVYYSARARRLNESKQILINDVCFVLDKLGLGRMHNNFTKTLSGGQRKRVNVALEIVACPKVLLLDEPTSGLDTVSCDDLFDLLQLIKFSAAGPVTIITVIHQPSQELFEKIDEIFFLTPLCCLAYQGPRPHAKDFLKQKIFSNPRAIPPPRHNDCDTCFIMLTNANNHVDNHQIEDRRTSQPLTTYSWKQRAWYPFYYVLRRSMRQIYIRGVVAEVAYMIAYFLLGTCVGFLFENKFQATCDMIKLTTIYFLITLSFGILTCISSQRLFGVEIADQTFERESRNYYHPFQYWLAKCLVDIFRMVLYPLLFLSMLYIEIVPRGSFSFYFGVMVLLSFVCSGIGQLVSVIFNRTEYAYLAGTIIALLSCLLSGFSPSKAELNQGGFIVVLSFSRHVQSLLFRHESKLYLEGSESTFHIWGTSVEGIRQNFDYNNSENPNFWMIFIGFLVRALTFLFIYGKSEYRSTIRFHVTNLIPNIKSFFKGESCRDRSLKQQAGTAHQLAANGSYEDMFSSHL